MKENNKDIYFYGYNNLFDKDISTAWVEGVDGSGINEYLLIPFYKQDESMFSYKKKKNINIQLQINNGYCKNESLFNIFNDLTKDIKNNDYYINVLIKKEEYLKEEEEEILTLGCLEVNLDRREVKKEGEVVELTPSEYAILTTLCQNVGRPYSRLQLLNATLGESYAGYERAIDTHVSNLRKKIESNPQKPVYILTVYGLGYKFGDQYEVNQ